MARRPGITLLLSLGLILAITLAACGEDEPTRVVALTAVTPPTPTVTGGPTPTPTPTYPPEPTATPKPVQLPAEPTPFPTPDPAWVDTDGDGFPDNVELLMDTDPFTDECLAVVGCGPAQAADARKTLNIILVLEASAGMEQKLDGIPSIDLLREQALAYAYGLPLGINLGVVVYGQGEGGCASAELNYPLGPLDRETFWVALHSFAPGGDSPAAAALEATWSALAGQEEQNSFVLFVSTSGDTCGADLCELVEALRADKQGLSPRIHVIGLDVETEVREQIRCLSDATSGTYFEARSAQEFYQAWDILLRQATQWARTSSCMAPNHRTFSQCLSERVTDYLHWTQESGFMREHMDYGMEVMERMNARVMQERELDLPPTKTP